MLFKIRSVDLIYKFGIGNVYRYQSAQSSPWNILSGLFTTTNKNFNRDFSDENSTLTGNIKTTLSVPPKRSPNVFALFVRDQFKKFPPDMPIKEKFVRAGQEWRELSDEQKEQYKKMMADGFVRYRKEMNAYLESLTPEDLALYKKQQKEKSKEKTKLRIKLKLRKLNYPKRNCSAYLFFIKDKLKQQYPDGVYPSVRTPEHIRHIGIWSQQWRNITPEDRKPYDVLAEADRRRYFDALEQWKHELAKPENEENFLELERLSKKIENYNKSSDELEKLKRKQRRVAAKIVKSRIKKRDARKKSEKTKSSKKASNKKKI